MSFYKVKSLAYRFVYYIKSLTTRILGNYNYLIWKKLIHYSVIKNIHFNF